MIVLIPLSLIDDNPFQTRAAYAEEAIRELADSIAGLREVRPETCGLIHVPPARVVDELEPDGPVDPHLALVNGDESLATYRYQVAAGHSRLRAFRLLAEEDPEAWGAMPLDLGVLDDQAMADVAWAENQKRKDLSAIEEARALQAAMGRFGWTQEQVAGRWKLARSTVANKLRLLGLPADLQEKVIAGEVGERAVRALLPALDAGVDAAVKTGLESIINGGAPDAVERAVTWELKRRSVDLSEGHWSPDWPGARHGLDVPPCQGCRHRRKLDGDWRCFDADCYKRKATAWNDHQVALAIAAEQEHCGTKLVKYPQYDYGMVTFNYNAQKAVFDATCRPGCKHGRLGLLANVPGWMARDRDSRKAREGEAWFVCDRSRCMGSLSSHTTRAETDWERERREAEERVRARIAEIMDQARVELDAATVSRLFGQAKLRDFVMKGVMDAVRDDRLKRELKKGRWDVATDLGFWRAVALAWLAAAPGSVWSSTDVDATMGARYRELRAGLGLPEQASVDGAGVSPETPDPDLQDPDGDEAAAAALLRETQAGIRAALAAAAGPAWTCCVCGQAFGADVAVGLVLLDSDEHPQSGAYLCEACLRDTPAGGAALGVEGLAAAAHFCLQQGEWAMDVCVMGRPCLLCGQKKEGFGAGGWALREMPAGRAHDIQLCPECVAAGRAYQVTAWSPNGKNPNLAHHWTYQPDGSWSSACGQVQAAPWRPEADTAKHCASCARIVKAETG